MPVMVSEPMEECVLDLPTTHSSANPHPPARALLNFKNIDYTTTWVEYPDIAPLFEKLGVQPNPPSAVTPYAIPAVTLADGKTHIMDSQAIATRLEQDHPDPPAHVSDPITEEATTATMNLFAPLRAVLVPRVRKQNIQTYIPYPITNTLT